MTNTEWKAKYWIQILPLCSLRFYNGGSVFMQTKQKLLSKWKVICGRSLEHTKVPINGRESGLEFWRDL